MKLFLNKIHSTLSLSTSPYCAMKHQEWHLASVSQPLPVLPCSLLCPPFYSQRLWDPWFLDSTWVRPCGLSTHGLFTLCDGLQSNTCHKRQEFILVVELCPLSISITFSLSIHQFPLPGYCEQCCSKLGLCGTVD